MNRIKKDAMIPLGTSALVIAIVLQRFATFEIPLLAFLEGVLTGFSFTLNLAGLYFTSKTEH